ncbi:MAG TPA: DEAD/DEAH box helicase [Anaeromyxobacteraceae bacterium]|nr:DEAD/DEAH box helicase [Anaeromyxobacteraceae bacterium]
MTFETLGAHPALSRALAARGFRDPTPVQAAVLAPSLRGRDLLVSARTGSGKTVAFGLLLADALLGGEPAADPAGRPRALVVAPTRELAAQVERELSWLLGEAGVRVVSCLGGMDPRREARTLAEGAHVVVGTPGRLRDHLERGNLDLAGLGVLVLDEADEMLDMGFRDELEALLAASPPERRTLLFSATLPRPIAELARRYTRDASRVAATPPEEAHGDIATRAHLVASREREHVLVNVLRSLDPGRALAFCATREAAHHVASSLSERGFEAVAISGELTQPERIRALKALRDGRARVLVATDVAARGLDLPGLDLVVHVDLPRDSQVLQHRSGRTGRAGKKGLAVLLATPEERHRLSRMAKEAGLSLEWEKAPSAEEVRARDEERLRALAASEAARASEEELLAARRLLEERTPLEVAAAFLRRERARLPSAEELPETARAALEAPRAERPARAARRAPAGDAVWFTISLGSERKADPKWILPLVCRRGGITRAEVGKIVVAPRETRFEVARAAAAAFAKAARRPDPRAPGVRIEVVAEGSRRRRP